jgi:hypothetical protein
METMNLCLKLWPVLTGVGICIFGIGSTLFYLGKLSSRMELNSDVFSSSIKRAFENIECLNKFMNQQEVKNGNFEKGLEAFKILMIQSAAENSHAHNEIMVRIDKMFEWMGKNSK